MLTLNRYISDLKQTRGILLFKGVPLCHTLELPNLQNQHNISCIPVGTYNAHKSTSSLHGPCIRLAYVSCRSGILIHPGNNLSHTRGCILPGLDLTASSVLSSTAAMQRLLNHLPDQFKLEIKELK